MRFAYTIVYVEDVAATVGFWERAFGGARRFVAAGGDYAELETGATTLAFAARSLAESHGFPVTLATPEAPALGIEVGFATEDVAAAYARAVAAGAAPAMAPTVQPWGQTVAYVRDVNGVLVELCTPLGD